MTFPKLQIYGQTAWHDPACIVGTDDGLRALRAMLDEILDPPNTDSACVDDEVFAYDGEGYVLFILRREEEPPENHYSDIEGMGGGPQGFPKVCWEVLRERADARRKAREEGKADER